MAMTGSGLTTSWWSRSGNFPSELGPGKSSLSVWPAMKTGMGRCLWRKSRCCRTRLLGLADPKLAGLRQPLAIDVGAQAPGGPGIQGNQGAAHAGNITDNGHATTPRLEHEVPPIRHQNCPVTQSDSGTARNGRASPRNGDFHRLAPGSAVVRTGDLPKLEVAVIERRLRWAAHGHHDNESGFQRPHSVGLPSTSTRHRSWARMWSTIVRAKSLDA
jgi:hypothetical protein